MKRIAVLITLLLTLALSVYAGGQGDKEAAGAKGAKPYAGQTLRMVWAVFAPADSLQDLCNKDFTEKTGIKVVIDQLPWSDYVAKYNAELIAHGDNWDIIIGDSQDLGNGTLNKHYVDLTSFYKEYKLTEKFTASGMATYSEYPKGSGHYVAVPVLCDPSNWAYRKDLFENAENKKAFKAKFGYELGVPTTWKMLVDIATFFYHPEKNFYGVGVYGDNGYDSVNMMGEMLQWCYGGDLADFKTMKVEGIVNSKASVEGIEVYRTLYKMCPPGWGTAYFEETHNAYLSGIIPMEFNFSSVFPALENPEVNKFYKDTAYFVTPAGPGGKQFTSLGGQTASISSYTKKKAMAMEWLKWWVQDATQVAWGHYKGSFNCSNALMNDPGVLEVSRANPTIVASVPLLRDWFNIPEYAKTIRMYADAVGKYVIGGQGTAQQALDTVAKEWTELFQAAGYYK